MSEKIKCVWRKGKDVVSLCVEFMPIVFQTLLLIGVLLLVSAMIQGAIVSLCWNVAIKAMFGFKKMRIFQAFVLTFTIGCLRTNYSSGAKQEYTKIKNKIFDMSKKEKRSKTAALILVGILVILSILITIFCVRYSWNNILPKLINIDLVKINPIQALGFSYIFNFFFKNSDNEKSKEKQENNEIIKTNSTEAETTDDIKDE